MSDVFETNSSLYFRVSVLWGALMGLFAYVVIRFPWWFVLNVPDDGQRGVFFRPVETVATVLLGMMISAIVFRLLMRRENLVFFSLGYTLTAFLIPFILLAMIIFPLYATPPFTDPMEPIAGWLFASLLPQTCLLPFGLLSSVIFYLVTTSNVKA